jgi:dihydroneopterin aldolase
MKVKISQFTFDTIIGILPFEREQLQPVVVDCSFKYRYKKGKFVNYVEITHDIKTLMQEKKFELLEEAVLYIKKYLKKQYAIKKIKLCIAKPTILDNCIVAVAL